MAPLIGKEMTESVFLERFASLCVDPLFHVRKVCAANFGDFSNVVGCEATEQVLVSSDILVKSSQHFGTCSLHSDNKFQTFRERVTAQNYNPKRDLRPWMIQYS
jgi:hypothetical protein